jgi:hypothetical protein
MTGSWIGRTARRAYFAGLAMTLAVAIAGQVLLGRLPEGQGTLEAVRDFGYAFTGTSLIGGYLLARRAMAIRERARRQDPPALRRLILREYLAIAFACTVTTAFGVLYWGLGGRAVERHARTFIALGPAAFLVLAVRPSRWAPEQTDSP